MLGFSECSAGNRRLEVRREETVTDLFERTVILDFGQCKVDRTDEVRTLRVDEPEFVRADASRQESELLAVLADVPLACGVIDDDRVDVTIQQRLRGQRERFEPRDGGANACESW